MSTVSDNEVVDVVRRDDIDIAKGIGIILVVTGHTVGFARGPIYLTHMPLFFLISGLLSQSDPAQRLGRRIVSIAVPYSAFLAILWIVPSFFAFATGTATASQTLEDIGRAIIGGETLHGVAAVFWFPASYALLLAFAAYVLTRQSRTARIWLTIAPLSIALVVADAAPRVFLPLAANVVPVAFGFFLVGRTLRNHDFSAVRLDNLLVLTVGVFALAAAHFGAIPTLDMKYAAYGMPVVSLGAAVFAALAVIVASAGLARTPVRGALAGLGKASMFVMYSHLAIAGFLKDVTRFPGWVIVIVTIVICYALSRPLRRCRALSFLFYGVFPSLHAAPTRNPIGDRHYNKWRIDCHCGRRQK